MRMTVLTAEALTLGCPYCGEPQPCPTGSELWLPSEVNKIAGEKRACVACDEMMLIDAGTKATVNY